MPTPLSYFLPSLPEGLEGLSDLALDLRWSWNHAADELWRRIDPEVWGRTGNPWLILQTVAVNRLESLAHDSAFLQLVDSSRSEHQAALQAETWFDQTFSADPFSIAYFSMEYGLSEALPIYSGGLGILAGDYLKTASDLGVPVVGLGLLYQQGYFRQVIDLTGHQSEFFPYNDPSQLPIIPVRDKDGEWLRTSIEFPGRPIWLRCWQGIVGRVKLYLLDSNDPMNDAPDRGITGELYGGGPELRLQQEMILGIGGWRLLETLGLQPEICHLNEGHAAFAVLERVRNFMSRNHQSFEVSLAATRPGNVFTTHTPVEAGFDRFSTELVRPYLSGYADQLGTDLEKLTGLGRQDPENSHEPLNMAFLATRCSGSVNGVSRLHGEVSRHIFQPLYPRWPHPEVPVTHVTNGIHVPSWDSAPADALWTTACGKDRWLSTMETIIDDFSRVSDESLWRLRTDKASALLSYVHECFAEQMLSAHASSGLISQCVQFLDPDALTIGFARRFTAYKRPNLLLRDPARLDRILTHPKRPVQLIIAGKAHPRDDEGKALLREWWEYSARPNARGRVIFLSDYDMALAEHLVQGVDLWVNTPLRPWEACGTSGMKVLVNGGLNLSELDGWWSEAYQPEAGWAIGDGREHREPGWDDVEADQLYRLLEEEIVPCFYERDSQGIPRAWVASMRASMSELTPQFSANRMVREYIDGLYSPALNIYRRRIANNCQEAALLCRWRDSLAQHWHKLRFGSLTVDENDGNYHVDVTVRIDDLDQTALQVQLYADPQGGGSPEVHIMEPAGTIESAVNLYAYTAILPARRPIEDYTPRIVPHLDGCAVPLEDQHILWYDR